MRFQVPQFIEVEDKIFGPLTIKQFIYLAGGAGLSFLLYAFLPFFIAIIFIIPILIFSIALAFYKFNNKPFINVVEAAFKFMFASKLYIWKKDDSKVQKATVEKQEEREAMEYAKVMVPKVSGEKLKDLTWSLDIKDSIYSQEANGGKR
ncbi:MAG: PrgI family protein [Patescibacteria group bacterium]